MCNRYDTESILGPVGITNETIVPGGDNYEALLVDSYTLITGMSMFQITVKDPLIGSAEVFLINNAFKYIFANRV